MGSAAAGKARRRGTGGGIVAVAACLAAACLWLASAPAARAQEAGAILAESDLQAAFADLEAFGGFFGAFARRDTNTLAKERWHRLSTNYQSTAQILRDLLAGDDLILQYLPAGQRSSLLDGGRIALDATLDGVWSEATPLALDASDVAVRRRDLLVPELMAALARRLPSQDWPWLSDHLRAVGGLAELAADPAARPFLARFFHAKDAYLRLALLRVSEGDPAARQVLARRQAAIFEGLRGLRPNMVAIFGLGPGGRIQRDWADYVASVDGFAATRGWRLLDPTLRRTQVGALTRGDADPVEQAAAAFVAAAPRSTLAEALSRAGGAGKPPPRSASAGQGEGAPGPLQPQPDRLTPEQLAARLPLESLALAPQDFAASGDVIADRVFAARVEEALAQPDLRRLVAEKEAALEAALAEIASLESRVGELDAALESTTAEAARLQFALAAAEAARETRRAEAAASPAGEVGAAEPAAPPVSVSEPDSAPEPESEPEPESAPAAGNSLTSDTVAALRRIEDRQTFLAVAVAAVLVLVLLLWLRGRRSAAREAARSPLLLSAPPEAGTAAGPAARPIIDVEETVEAPVPATGRGRRPAEKRDWPRPLYRVNGETAQSREARAARKAGAARADATRAAELDKEAAAAAHPMVKALRSGNLPLFEMLLGEMTGLTSPQLQRIAYGGQGEDLAVACRAKGVEKLLFGSIFLLTDSLRGGDADEDPARVAEVLRIYDRLPPAVAEELLEKWQRGGADAEASPGDHDLG